MSGLTGPAATGVPQLGQKEPGTCAPQFEQKRAIVFSMYCNLQFVKVYAMYGIKS
jgi:hypothetical protein